ncbi:MAG: 5-(carboxyamino)imidazole ribonucleotide synthase [Mariniblastus sp.]
MTEESTDDLIIPPGSTIGILGSGQLGRMMAIAAKHMGYRVHIFSSSLDSPAGQVADLEIQASLDDLVAVESFAKNVDVVTVETENIPLVTLDAASKFAPTYPGRVTMEVCQNRSYEKQFLDDNQFPTCEFEIVRSLDDLEKACKTLMPGVLKTVTGGYDGKGQAVIRSAADIENAWASLNADEAILEEWIDYDFEFSVVGFRNSAGLVQAYPSIRNEHANGILDVSISPSGLSEQVEAQASETVFGILNLLESVGVLTVEFFYRKGEILVNELAPRPHNSGHLTIEGHVTNQFEQHIRSICGLMAGSTSQLKPVAMANLLGNQWSAGEPQWHYGLSLPNTKLHLYGKGTPELERKMGHMTSIGETPEEAKEHVIAARKLLSFGLENSESKQDSVSR